MRNYLYAVIATAIAYNTGVIAATSAPQLPAIVWWSSVDIAETFYFDGRNVDGAINDPWLPIGSIVAQKRCVPHPVRSSDGGIEIQLGCTFAPKLGVPRGMFFRIRVRDEAYILPQLSIVCLVPGSVPKSASIGTANLIWPVSSTVPAGGCP
jgi:hypothetical protein